jgi:hypothetical protein
MNPDAGQSNNTLVQTGLSLRCHLQVPAALALTLWGCADRADVGSEAQAVAVTWTNMVGVSATGNSLTKSISGAEWNAGAVSVETLAGDGFVEFTTGENTKNKMAGLSFGDAGQYFSDIDFALYLRSNGAVGVYEGGLLRGLNFTSYIPGDVFRVELHEGVVRYSVNGSAPFYTSGVAPNLPLLVDVSLHGVASTIQDVNLIAASEACPEVVGTGTVCTGSYLVYDADDLAAISSCGEITGDLGLSVSGPTVVALKSLERVGGDLRLGATSATRVLLPNLKEVGGTFESSVFPTTTAVDISRLRVAGAVETNARFIHLGMPCLQSTGDLTAKEWNGVSLVPGPLYVPRLRTVTGSISGRLTAPALETVGGDVSDELTAPALVSVGGDVTAHPFAAPVLTTIDGALEYRSTTSVPSLQVTGAITFVDPVTIALPSLVEVTGPLAAGTVSSSGTCDGIATTNELSLPSLERAGSVIVCWPFDEVSLPALEKIAGPPANAWGLVVAAGGSPGLLELSSLTTVSGNVKIFRASDLPLLTRVRGKLIVMSPLTAPVLDQVNSGIELRAPFSADALTTVRGRLTMYAGIDTLSLPSLTTVDAIIAPNATDLAVLELPVLSSVTGNTGSSYIGAIRLNHSQLAILTLPSLGSIPGYLELIDNRHLVALGAPLLTSIGPSLKITSNDQLPDCEATDLLAQLQAAGWAGAWTISGNAGPGTCP